MNYESVARCGSEKKPQPEPQYQCQGGVRGKDVPRFEDSEALQLVARLLIWRVDVSTLVVLIGQTGRHDTLTMEISLGYTLIVTQHWLLPKDTETELQP